MGSRTQRRAAHTRSSHPETCAPANHTHGRDLTSSYTSGAGAGPCCAFGAGGDDVRAVPLNRLVQSITIRSFAVLPAPTAGAAVSSSELELSTRPHTLILLLAGSSPSSSSELSISTISTFETPPSTLPLRAVWPFSSVMYNNNTFPEHTVYTAVRPAPRKFATETNSLHIHIRKRATLLVLQAALTHFIWCASWCAERGRLWAGGYLRSFAGEGPTRSHTRHRPLPS